MNLHSTNGATVTFAAQWLDDIAPVIATFTAKSDAKKTSQTVSLKCTDAV